MNLGQQTERRDRSAAQAAVSRTKRKSVTHRLLIYEALGFAILIATSWLNELADLTTRLFGGSAGHNWREAALETAVILAAGTPTFLLTLRLARRLVFLEKFLRVCAWCRKIGVDDEWISMESYFEREMKTGTTHGVCPECAAKLIEQESRSCRPNPPALPADQTASDDHHTGAGESSGFGRPAEG